MKDRGRERERAESSIILPYAYLKSISCVYGRTECYNTGSIVDLGVCRGGGVESGESKSDTE